MRKIAQVLFTRVPIAGKTKKRLMPFLTAQQAAELHAGMILDTINVMKKVRADLFICYGPAGAERLFRKWVGKPRIYPQRGRTLWQRVINCLVDLRKQGYEAAYLIVSDTPSLQFRYLQQAVSAIGVLRPTIVIGPSHDRGVYLLGMNQLKDLRFLEHIPWGKGLAFDVLMLRIRQSGCHLKFLPMVKDIDEKEDVYWLLKECTRISGKESKHVRDFFRAYGRSIFVKSAQLSKAYVG